MNDADWVVLARRRDAVRSTLSLLQQPSAAIPDGVPSHGAGETDVTPMLLAITEGLQHRMRFIRRRSALTLERALRVPRLRRAFVETPGGFEVLWHAKDDPSPSVRVAVKLALARCCAPSVREQLRDAPTEAQTLQAPGRSLDGERQRFAELPAGVHAVIPWLVAQTRAAHPRDRAGAYRALCVVARGTQPSLGTLTGVGDEVETHPAVRAWAAAYAWFSRSR